MREIEMDKRKHRPFSLQARYRQLINSRRSLLIKVSADQRFQMPEQRDRTRSQIEVRKYAVDDLE